MPHWLMCDLSLTEVHEKPVSYSVTLSPVRNLVVGDHSLQRIFQIFQI